MTGSRKEMEAARKAAAKAQRRLERFANSNNPQGRWAQRNLRKGLEAGSTANRLDQKIQRRNRR